MRKHITVIFSILMLIILSLTIYCVSERYINAEWRQSRFDLREKIHVNGKYQTQATYATCYAFAALNSVETNLLLHHKKYYSFSELHVEYMTSYIFGGNRGLDAGGEIMDVIDYINNGKGPVLERDLPNRRFEENEYNLLLEAEPVKMEVETIQFEYNEETRENVKKHIVKNGSVAAYILFEPLKEEYINEKSYGYCNLYNTKINHVVSIIGWDDAFSKYDFPEENRPQNDGAYIAMSFWKPYGKNTIIYISYEDRLVEKTMYGITKCILK